MDQARSTPYVIRLANPGKYLYPPPLADISALEFRKKLSAVPTGSRRAQLYLHLPFCETICTFCPIHKYQLTASSPVDEYIQALKTELRELSRLPLIAQLKFESVYFGGGTPSVIGEQQLQELVELIRSSFCLHAPQITFEGHVHSLTRAKIRLSRELGFNRLSTGVQTFDQALRRLLNLTPTENEIRRCLEVGREEGFDDFNVDLMFNLPGQTPAIWETDLYKAISLAPSGMDLYDTVLANSTRMHMQIKRREMIRDEDPGRMAQNYILAEHVLKDSGYHQQNLFVWNREGYENRLLDCQSGLRDDDIHIVGAGLTAYSFINGEPFINEASITNYVSRVRDTRHGVKWHHECTGREQMERFMILSLEEFRLDRGRFLSRFGLDMDEVFRSQISSFLRRGLVQQEEFGYRLTELGRSWATTMSVEFYGESVLEDIFEGRLNRSYFGGMTREEEFELAIFGLWHPRQLWKQFDNLALAGRYLGSLRRENPNWFGEFWRVFLLILRRHGLPDILWHLSVLAKHCLGKARGFAGVLKNQSAPSKKHEKGLESCSELAPLESYADSSGGPAERLVQIRAATVSHPGIRGETPE